MRLRLCALLILLWPLLSACTPDPPPDPFRLSGQTMGTTWSVILPSAPGATAAAALRQQLQQRLDRIEGLMSTYDPASELSRFNSQSSTEWFAIADDTARVVELSLAISRLTGGAFDVSVGPLVELWGFGATPRGRQIPSSDQIRERLLLVGYDKIELRRQPAAIRKQVPELRIDLSAVAKGYAVDALAELLEGQGITAYLVEIGGELRLAGSRGAGAPWRIAIEQPQEGARDIAASFPLARTGLATSGNYRNFYLEDGQRYAHTLDPVSGRPVRHKLASVTVLDPSCARADALATALMVLGEEVGRSFCEQHDLAAYFLIHEQAGLAEDASPAFQRFVAGVQP
jgi:thiamine biosynthesis lipoprotein